ncbi:MAG: type II toxin-antitoxin system RelE/ParE family toxin [Rhodobacteraceae bacterium]|nr:type II toxin-antitoxin system RelE/ParE family toxin [Paracoccaceae bacterium]
MSRFTLSHAAENDLSEIWWYTARTWGEAQANLYTGDLNAAFQNLASGGSSGRAYHGREGYYRYTVARHVIFFKEGDEGIIVMRILHQRMDVNSRL